MSTCRMETKTVDALYLVWFKQCDLYDLENEHQCGATYFFYTSKEQETEELEKSQQKNALRFNGMWNQPQKKTHFFATSKRSSSIGKMVIHFSSAHLWAQPSFPDGSDALLPQQDGRQRPHDGHREQGSQDFRLVESWKNVAPLLPCKGAVSGHVWCVLWGFKLWREGKLMQDIRMQDIKNSRKISI